MEEYTYEKDTDTLYKQWKDGVITFEEFLDFMGAFDKAYKDK